MRNHFYKFFSLILAFLVFFSSTFYFFAINSFAVEVGLPMDEAFIEQWIFPTFSINNEWTFGQAGSRLRDAIEQHAGSDNLSYSTDYNNAYAKSFGINDLVDPFDLSKADEFWTAYFANDINYKKYVTQHDISEIKDYLTSEDQHKLADALVDENVVAGLGYDTKDAAFLNCVVNTIQLGGQTILVAFDKAGNWLGSTFQNIISKVNPITDEQYISLNENINTEFPQSLEDKISFGFDYYLPASSNGQYIGQVHFYVKDQSYVLFPTYNNNNTFSFLLVSDHAISNPEKLYFYRLWLDFPENYFNVSALTQPIGNFYYTSIDANPGAQSYYNKNLYATREDILSVLSTAENLDTVIPPYTVPIVDTQNQPYVVPDIGDLATVIGDIYPALELLDDSILTIPNQLADIQELIDTLPADIADAIAGVIDDVIADAITIPDILIDEKTEPSPDPDPDPDPDDPFPEYPPSLPTWIWPSTFPDIFDVKGLDIFKPIFDIVGIDYSMYNTWIMIPTILIFVLIIYIIVSLL